MCNNNVMFANTTDLIQIIVLYNAMMLFIAGENNLRH